MNTGGIQFKKFKQDFHYKNTNVKVNINKLPQFISQVHNKVKEQYSHISPQKKPTSFRQLSGSREKNKIFSGKKIALENKLNTLRSNQKCGGFDISNEDIKVKNIDFGSAKKSVGLFSKLLTARSPRELNKNSGFDDSNKSSSNGNLDNSGISFSAFKGVNLGQNENYSNIVLQKTASTDQQKQKGLKFKAFPHRRGSQKTSPPNPPILLLNQGPLIQQKGRSHSKSQKSINSIQKQKSPLKTTPTPLIINKVQKALTFNNQIKNQYGLGFSRQQSQEVIRSRQGSIAFDMSPTIC